MARDIAALTSDGAGEPRQIADVLVQLGVQFHDLSALRPDLRRHVTERNAYRVTRTNLVQVVGDNDANLSLDALAAGYPHVHDHVVAHLTDCIKVLDDEPGVHPVQDPATFATVLNGLSGAALEEIAAVIERCDDACQVGGLKEIPIPQWPFIVHARRCSVTMANIQAYLEEYGEIDDALGGLLAAVTAIDEAGEASLDQRQALGVQVLNADSIPLARLEPLLGSLGLHTPISAQAVTRAIGHVVPGLVASGVLADDELAFNLIDAHDWTTVERLIRVSNSFPTYLPQLGFDGSDLVHLFTSPRVAQNIQLAALQDSVVLQGLTSQEVTLVAEHAATMSIPLPLDSLIALARAAAGPAIILQLLARQIAQLSSEELFSIAERDARAICLRVWLNGR